MGILTALTGVGSVMREGVGLARVVRGDKAKEAEAEHLEHMAALSQLGAEFQQERASWFDIAIDGINRLPRPMLAMGTLGLFVYSMADPIGFASRMQGLVLVPDQLWWLLGAIVSFYFGARELHYFRQKTPSVSVEDLRRVAAQRAEIDAMASDEETEPMTPDGTGIMRHDRSHPDYNAALEEWRISTASTRTS